MTNEPYWAENLKNSLLDALRQPELSYHEFEKVRASAANLDGLPCMEELSRALTGKLVYFEQCYQAALHRMTYGSISAIEDGIRALAPLDGYKDAHQKLAEGQERIVQLRQEEENRKVRRRKLITRICLAAVLMLVLAVAGVTMNTYLRKRAAKDAVAGAQALADAGQYADAIAAITVLIEDGETVEQCPELYNVAGAILESSAAADDAAFATDNWKLLLLLQSKKQSVASDKIIAETYLTSLPDADAGVAAISVVYKGFLNADHPTVLQALERSLEAQTPKNAWKLAQRAASQGIIDRNSETLYNAYVRYTNDVDEAEAWNALLSLKRDKALDTLPQEIISLAAGNHLRAAWAEVAANATQQEVQAWATQQMSWMTAIPPAPDTALQLVYTLNDAGYDVAAIFPEGIPVAIPMADRILALLAAISSNESEADRKPNLTTVLPVSVTQSMLTSGATTTYSAPSKSMLNAAVEDYQQSDDSYDVRLLPEYLFLLPEDARPATFAQCGSLMCMEYVYSYTSIIESVQQTTRGSEIISQYSTFYPAFTALDLIAFYDLTDSSLDAHCWWNATQPKVDDEDWFSQYQDSGIVQREEYRVASHDRQATEEAFSTFVSSFDSLRFLFMLR
ncbi:MAG: hypothetical protein ACI4MG_01685 [Aristaeellaceae bacterium]